MRNETVPPIFPKLSAIAFPTIAMALWLSLMVTGGCGTTREYNATSQLVMSDAVDRSIAAIDFRPLSGRKVYLDTSYMRQIKGESFVNADYTTSAMRQQIAAAGCLLQDSSNDAELIIEARIGTLGTDDHRVTFGIPENKSLGSVISLVPGAPAVPTIPEIAFARREAREAAAKVAAFAYDRETREPVWQSGVKPANATAKDTWVLGVGPFQGGSIRERTKLAGGALRFNRKKQTGSPAIVYDRPPVDYTAVTRFQEGEPLLHFDENAIEMIGSDSENESIAELQDTKPSQPTSGSDVESIAEKPTESLVR
ncbi:hypothetical protein Pla22_34390 [Rubripirellula amarantea]|uniref:Uncharacterized protein n=1 Tax=Rubripirellula amarantea TaxID=2527999 RepID=A0A5C5WIP4_9BACT|nr:DUF6655 family protein [Rubripirellula amarantea]TWT50696.1 hypothetical protein Pla22_34390 [Rubripirellula amarantea]